MAFVGTIVTFKDADGDEFPVRVGASLEIAPRERIVEVARSELQTMIDFDNARPTLPVEVASVEAEGV
jgi:hypothetical protein